MKSEPKTNQKKVKPGLEPQEAQKSTKQTNARRSKDKDDHERQDTKTDKHDEAHEKPTAAQKQNSSTAAKAAAL